jgi:F0F1-type ATP synthase membrane subunit b/b'
VSHGVRQFPLRWRIGRVDPQFNVSPEQLRLAIDQAIALWELEAGRKLFVYDEAGFPVEMVFDERHQQVLENRSESDSLSALRGQSHAASSRYKAAAAQMRVQGASYQASLDAYNRRIAQINASGGAGPEDAAYLQGEEDRLRTQLAQLEQVERDVEAMRLEANRIVDEFNAEVERFNQGVHEHNARSQAAPPQVIGQCLYTETTLGGTTTTTVNSISVYSFRNARHLAVVLAHEFGHAIGVAHVEGDGALMSAVESGKQIQTELMLTDRDREALAAAMK